MIYTQGVAMFCQDCGFMPPRVPIDMAQEHWYTVADADGRSEWNRAIRHKRAYPQVIHTESPT